MTAHAAPCTAPVGYRVAPMFVVRVAGLPRSVLAELRSARTVRAIDEILDLDARVADLADDVNRLLYELIGTAGPDDRGRLVGLRRAVFQDRRCAPTLAALEPVLPRHVADRIREWEGLRALRARRVDALPDAVAADREDTVAALVRVAARPVIGHALVHAQPALYRALRSGHLDRRALLSLTRYVVRAAAKTSPRSTFTSCALGEWRSDTAPTPPTGAADAVVDVDPAVVRRVRRRLAGTPHLWPALAVRINPSLVVDGDVLSVLRDPEGTAVDVVRATPAVRDALDQVRRADTVAALAARLRGSSATGDRLVAGLVRSGVVETFVPVPDQADPPLAHLRGWLSGTGVDDPAGAGLLRLDGLLASLRDATPDERLAATTTVTAAAADVTGDRHTDGKVFYDSAVHPGVAAAGDLETSRAALTDLDRLRRFFGLFDRNLPFRLGLTRFFVERFGAGARVPFPYLYRAYRQALTTSEELATAVDRLRNGVANLDGFGAADTLLDSGLPDVTALAALRADVRRWVAGLLPDPDGVVRIESGELLDRISSWPAFVTAPASIAAYVQPDSARLVVNWVTTGHGRGISRVARSAGVGLPGWWTDDRSGPMLAEFDGVYGSSLDVRSPAAPYAIDCPGTVSARPADRLLPIGQLTACHDPERQRLRLFAPRHGRDVLPVHTTMLSELLLPPPLRLLLGAFAPASELVYPSEDWLRPFGRDLPGTRPCHTPRLEIGLLTVRRAHWSVAGGAVPTRLSGESVAAFVLRFNRWLASNGIPRRCFVRILPVATLGRPSGVFAKSRKPMFFDVGNEFLVLGLERELRGADAVVEWYECLPDPAAPGGGPDERVVEHVIEIAEDDRVEP